MRLSFSSDSNLPTAGASWLAVALMATAIVIAGCGQGKDSNASRTAPGRSTSPIASSGTGGTTTSIAEPWVGLRFSSIPDSVGNFGGDTIVVADTVFSVRFVSSHGRHVLWLARGTGMGPSGAAEWTILAAMEVEPVGDERVFFHDCRLNKKPDPRIIALGLWDDLPLFTRIHRAWRPNIAARRFDEISVAGVDCKNMDHAE